MEKYEIRITKDAARDMEVISDYIKHVLKEPEIAKKIMKKIKLKIQETANYPEVYSIISSDEYIRYLNVRKVLVDNYIIFFELDTHKKIMYVARIIHGRRNWIDLIK